MEGSAKNFWANEGCVTMYKAKSIGNTERTEESEIELKNVNRKVVGISETRKKDENLSNRRRRRRRNNHR